MMILLQPLQGLPPPVEQCSYVSYEFGECFSRFKAAVFWVAVNVGKGDCPLLVIRGLVVWIILGKLGNVWSSFSCTPGGISTDRHEVVMIGILLVVGNQSVLLDFEHHNIYSTGKQGLEP